MNAEELDRVQRVFCAAWKVAPEDRDDVLDLECAGDASLRQEVCSLLGLAGRADELLEAPHLDVRALLRDEDPRSSS